MESQKIERPLAGRTALISGGGTGIGRGISEAFAASGANVALCGRRLEPLEETAISLQAVGAKTLTIPCDVTNPTDCERAVAATVQRFGALHILVNNAGVAKNGALANTSDDDISRMIAINLTGVALLAKYAYPALSTAGAQPGGACVLNISSSVANAPIKDFAVYSATKAAVVHFSRCMALEWAPKRIRVNCINPGVVETPIHSALVPPGTLNRALDMFAKLTPLGRIGQPADISAAALYLCGPHAEWVTGAELVVDGGISLS